MFNCVVIECNLDIKRLSNFLVQLCYVSLCMSRDGNEMGWGRVVIPIPRLEFQPLLHFHPYPRVFWFRKSPNPSLNPNPRGSNPYPHPHSSFKNIIGTRQVWEWRYNLHTRPKLFWKFLKNLELEPEKREMSTLVCGFCRGARTHIKNCHSIACLPFMGFPTRNLHCTPRWTKNYWFNLGKTWWKATQLLLLWFDGNYDFDSMTGNLYGQ